MATYQASDITKAVPGIDNACTYFGTVSPGVNTATGDVLQPCKIAGGVAICSVMINVRTAFASTAPASVGISHVDGSTPIMTTPATKIAPITDVSHATTGTKLLMPQAGAFVTEKDSYLLITFGTIATAATGVADYAVLGEFRGMPS